MCTNKSSIINTDEDDKFRFFIDLNNKTIIKKCNSSISIVKNEKIN